MLSQKTKKKEIKNTTLPPKKTKLITTPRWPEFRSYFILDTKKTLIHAKKIAFSSELDFSFLCKEGNQKSNSGENELVWRKGNARTLLVRM
jgi:hypothetical protein